MFERAPGRTTLGLLLVLSAAACSNLNPVRDFSRSAATLSTSYPVAASAYVDSATTSSPYLLGPAAASANAPGAASPSVAMAATGKALRAQRQQQVDAALELETLLGNYFTTLARLAGDDMATLAVAKSVGADMKSIVGGGLDRATLDAAASLLKTLGDFSLQPARERAVKELVRSGGPDAMRILAALRSVAADWRAQVANDARLVDDTLGVAVLARNVPPLLRLLATDRQAGLARDYAASLRRMSSVLASLDAVARAHGDMAQHLDELQDASIRLRLEGAAAELRAARASLEMIR